MKNLKTSIIILFVLTIHLLQANNIQKETVFFETAKSFINSSEKEKLTQILRANKYYLIGHTDCDGDIEYNQRLSKKRVDEVLHYLLTQGVEKDKISIEYYGESKPLNKNKTFEEKSENRRVEINYIIDPLMDFEVEKQIFTIENHKKVSITGKQGTEITFDANTFTEKNVKIELKEYYNTLDILSANLSTKAGEKLLESSGMIHISATANGKDVFPNKTYEIKFNRMSESEDFELFTGKTDKKLDVNWSLMNKTADVEIEEIESIIIDFSINQRRSPLSYVSDNGKYTWISKSGKNIEWKNWQQVFDYIDLVNIDNRQCFTNARMKISLNEKGQFIDVMTSHEQSKPYCDTLLRNSLTDRVVVDSLTEDSEIDMTFEMNFERVDSITAFYDQIEKEENRIALLNFDSINKFNQRNFNTQQRKKMEIVNKINRTKLAQYELTKIVTYAKSFGWVNCDRFRQNVPKTDFVVNVSTDMNVRMVSKRFNSFYNGHNDSQTANKKVFTAIPIGEKVTLICTTYKNDEIFVAIEKTSISKQAFSDFHFKKVSKEELRSMITNI